jgi:hypothetical protein
VSLRIRPITLKQARAFVGENHRHNDEPQGGKWAIALMRGDELVGVAICGRPVSGELQRRGYMEITRVCVLEGVKGGNSMLYARCRRIGQLMGYERFVSYNLDSESGVSLRAAGFERVARTRGGTWDRPKRPRTDKATTEPKNRWEAAP